MATPPGGPLPTTSWDTNYSGWWLAYAEMAEFDIKSVFLTPDEEATS